MTEPNPVVVSLEEQIVRMRGAGAPAVHPALLDVVREELCGFTVLRPRDWEELRHQYGGDGLAAPYWATAWPSGLTLAEAIADRSLGARRVLELGCGLAVPSLAAAAAGGRVLATDSSPDAVAFAAHNLALNELEGEVAMVDWREPGPLLEGGPWDLVLAADVLYLHRGLADLDALLPRLVDGTGEVWLADPGRPPAAAFLQSAGRWAGVSEDRSDDPGVTVHRLRARDR